MPELAYVNGEFMPIEEAVVPIEDRGMQFGDSLYEVVRLYDGKPFRLKEHLDRMRRGAEVINLNLEAAGDLEAVLNELIERAQIDTAFVYWQVTRGVAPREHTIPDDLTPVVIATVQEMQEIDESKYQKGSRAFTQPDQRWARRDVKATTLLPNIMARTYAINRGGYGAILYEDDGKVTEGAVSNVFCVINGVIRTHPTDHSVLPGISRATALECAEKLDLPYVEKSFTVQEMMDASEVFFTDTYCEVMPVVEIDSQVIGDGSPGPVAAKLKKAFRQVVIEETGADL